MKIIELVVNALIPFAIALEGIALFFAIIFFNKYKNTPLAFIPVLLMYSFISELICVFIYPGLNNALIYNIVAFFSFIYFLILYYKSFNNTRFKIASKIGAITIVSSFFIESFFIDVQTVSTLYSYMLGGCILILSIVLYFMEKLQTKESLDIKGDLLFWISIGLLLFYVGYLPIKLTRLYFASTNDMFNILKIVHLILVVLMNMCFILGFVWAKKKQ